MFRLSISCQFFCSNCRVGSQNAFFWVSSIIALMLQVADRDTLTSVAARFDTTPSELTKLNRLATPYIFPGQQLYVPIRDVTETESEGSTPVEDSHDDLPQEEKGTIFCLGKVEICIRFFWFILGRMCRLITRNIHLIEKIIFLNKVQSNWIKKFSKDYNEKYGS